MENRLTLIPGTEFKKYSASGNRMLLADFKCACGEVKTIYVGHVRRGNVRSCGCLNKEVAKLNCLKRVTHGGRNTRLYVTWRNMKGRCLNTNDKGYANYGGRGISVCEEWVNDFEAFRSWALSSGYQDHLTIDRINPDGNYEPNNCQWLTRGENTAKANKERYRNG